MATSPLDRLLVRLRSLGEEQPWLAEGIERLEGLRPPLPPRPLFDVEADLDALVGLETVKEQVRALVAFLEVQSRLK